MKRYIIGYVLLAMTSAALAQEEHTLPTYEEAIYEQPPAGTAPTQESHTINVNNMLKNDIFVVGAIQKAPGNTITTSGVVMKVRAGELSNSFSVPKGKKGILLVAKDEAYLQEIQGSNLTLMELRLKPTVTFKAIPSNCQEIMFDVSKGRIGTFRISINTHYTKCTPSNVSKAYGAAKKKANKVGTSIKESASNIIDKLAASR